MRKHKLRNKLLSLTLCMTMAAAALTGCGSSASGTQAPEKTTTATLSDIVTSAQTEKVDTATVTGKEDNMTLVVGASSDTTTLDPHCAGNSAAVNVLLPVVEQLVRYDADGNLVNWLCEDWEMLDTRTWKFYLRKGVKFHNGEEMKASDVVFSFKRATTPYAANVSYIMNMVDPDGLEIVDDYTVIVRTKDDFAPFIYYLPYIGASIISEKAYTEDEEGAKTHPVGTGPFVFDEYVKGDYTSYTRFDDYWGGPDGTGPAAYENLIIKAIPDTTARYIALETGEVDIAIGLSVNEISKIEENPDIYMSTSPTTVYTSIYFNCANGPFANEKFRQAIDYAIDEKAVVEAVHQGTATYTPYPVTQNTKYACTEELEPRYDVEKAKQLLEESGVDLSQTFELCVNENQARIDTATIVQSMLAEVGVNVEIKVMEYAAYNDYTSQTEGKQMWFSGWGAVGFPEPDNNLYGPLHSSQIPANNTCGYSDPELDKMLDEERNLPDGDEREQLIIKIQKYIRDHVPYLTFDNPTNIVGVRTYVEGFRAVPPTDQYYNNVSIIGTNN